MQSRAILALTLAPILVACGSSADGSGQSVDNDTINPVGTDTLPGEVVVTAAPNPASPTLTPTVTVNHQQVTLGTPSDFRPGTSYCLVVQDAHGNGDDCTINVESLKTTTYGQLGNVMYNGPPNTALEFWEFRNTPMKVSFAGAPSRGGYIGEQFGNVAIRIAAKYHATFGPLFDGLDYTVVAGQQVAVDLSSFAQRRSAKILPPPSIDLPDFSGCDSTAIFLDASRGGSHRQTDILKVNQAILVGEYAGDGQAAGTYSIRMNSDDPSLSAPMALSANVAESNPPTVQLGRIDVTDVAVKQNDGTTLVVPGFYVVDKVVTVNGTDTFQRTCANGAGAPTKTGVTVVPGKYRVTTSFQTHDNSTPNVQFITFP